MRGVAHLHSKVHVLSCFAEENRARGKSSRGIQQCFLLRLTAPSLHFLRSHIFEKSRVMYMYTVYILDKIKNHTMTLKRSTT